MESSPVSDSDSTCSSDIESEDASIYAWEARGAQAVNSYRVTFRRELDISQSQAYRQRAFVTRREAFLHEYDLDDAFPDKHAGSCGPAQLVCGKQLVVLWQMR